MKTVAVIHILWMVKIVLSVFHQSRVRLIQRLVQVKAASRVRDHGVRVGPNKIAAPWRERRLLFRPHQRHPRFSIEHALNTGIESSDYLVRICEILSRGDRDGFHRFFLACEPSLVRGSCK